MALVSPGTDRSWHLVWFAPVSEDPGWRNAGGMISRYRSPRPSSTTVVSSAYQRMTIPKYDDSMVSCASWYPGDFCARNNEDARLTSENDLLLAFEQRFVRHGGRRPGRWEEIATHEGDQRRTYHSHHFSFNQMTCYFHSDNLWSSCANTAITVDVSSKKTI